MIDGEAEERTMLIRVPEEMVTKGKGFYWVDLGDPQTLMRMVLMAIAEPGKVVVNMGPKEEEE